MFTLLASLLCSVRAPQHVESGEQGNRLARRLILQFHLEQGAFV